MKYSTLLVMSVLLLQGFQAYAADEPANTTNSTNNTIIQLGVPQSGKLNGTNSIVFEFNSTFPAGTRTRYSVYLGGFSKTQFDYSVSYNGSDNIIVPIDLTTARTVLSDGKFYIHQFEAKEGTYYFKLTHKADGETPTAEQPYTIVVSTSTPITSGEEVLDTIGSGLIKSYDLKVENPSALLVETALCVGQVFIALTYDDPAQLSNQFNTGYIAGTYEVKNPVTVWIDVVQNTPAVNGTVEDAEFKFKAELKAPGFSKPQYFNEAQKLLNYSNVTNEIKFEQVQQNTLGKATYNLSDFKIEYKLVAATCQKDLIRTLRCGLRKNETHSSVQIITLTNCNTTNCSAKVSNFNLTNATLYLGLEGEISNITTNNTTNITTNHTERVLYGEILTIYQTPTPEPSKPSGNKWWIYALIAVVALVLMLGVLFWRRSQQISLKMQEGLTSGDYKAIDA